MIHCKFLLQSLDHPLSGCAYSKARLVSHFLMRHSFQGSAHGGPCPECQNWPGNASHKPKALTPHNSSVPSRLLECGHPSLLLEPGAQLRNPWRLHSLCCYVTVTVTVTAWGLGSQISETKDLISREALESNHCKIGTYTLGSRGKITR